LYWGPLEGALSWARGTGLSRARVRLHAARPASIRIVEGRSMGGCHCLRGEDSA
jgi:hypothetical protein